MKALGNGRYPSHQTLRAAREREREQRARRAQAREDAAAAREAIVGAEQAHQTGTEPTPRLGRLVETPAERSTR